MAEEIKELLIDFLEDTKDLPGRRKFATFLEKIKEEFGDVSDVEKNESDARTAIIHQKTRVGH